ncbi:MAG: hypothetical protein VKS61_00995 [Candidatus Sericytochromatia bacterium]|nr:hypothetical protein [Candidatus Sericytochromatia bacterium]
MSTTTEPLPTKSTALTINRIKSLVHHWMSIWDMNTGDATPLIEVLSPEGFQINASTVPEPITTVAGVRAWFAEFPKHVKIDNHNVESIDIEELPNGRYRVLTKITCPGVTIDDKPFLVTSEHDWEVADYGGLFPRICTFTVHLTRH